MASCPFTSWQLDRERYGNSDLLNILGLQKSLQMVTAAMKLKDTCSLGEKLWQTSLLFSSSVVSDSLRPMDCSTPGFPALLHLPAPAQTHVHWVSDLIQPSHPLSSPSPPALCVSQHQDLFQWVSSSPQVTKVDSASASVLPMNIQDWFPLGLTDWISLQYKGLSRVFSNTTVQKHQFFGTQLSYCPTLTSIHDHWKNHSSD